MLVLLIKFASAFQFIINNKTNFQTMKAKLIIVLAAVAMLFTACGKEDNPGTGETGKNELIYNGVKYELESHGYGQNGAFNFNARTHVDDISQIADIDLFGGGMIEGTSQTFDLTQGPLSGIAGYTITVDFHVDGGKSFRANNIYGAWDGEVGGSYLENTTIFKSGTLTVTIKNDTFNLVLKGVLKNDDNVELYLYSKLNQ